MVSTFRPVGYGGGYGFGNGYGYGYGDGDGDGFGYGNGYGTINLYRNRRTAHPALSGDKHD